MELGSSILNLHLATNASIKSKKDAFLVYIDPKHNKAIRAEDSKKGFGIPVAVEEIKSTELMLILSRNGTFAFQFIIARFKNLKVIKTLNIHVKKNDFNHRQSIKVCSKSKTFLFYHESVPKVEVRSAISLKLKYFIDIEQICKTLNVSKWLPQIKSSIDFISVHDFRAIAMILGPKIVLISTREENVNQFESKSPFIYQTIFDCSEHGHKDNFVGLDYCPKNKLLFVAGLSSYVLLELSNGDNTVKNTKILRSEKINRGMRLLRWDPDEDAIVVAQRTRGNKEKFQIIDYRSIHSEDTVAIITIWKDQLLRGEVYNSSDHRLYYVDNDSIGRREIKTIDLRDFRNKYTTECDEDEEVVLNECYGERFASLPNYTAKHQVFYLRFYFNFLTVKPTDTPDDSFGKDISFRV